MITIKQGDVFESNMEVLVIPVNCVGVMGKGLALQFKNKYPEMYKIYKDDCTYHAISLGHLAYHSKNSHCNKGIIFFPTKNHWKDQSHMDDIQNGLNDFIRHIREWDIKNIAFPAIGCGLGGLYFPDVAGLIVKRLIPLQIDVEIYEFWQYVNNINDQTEDLWSPN